MSYAKYCNVLRPKSNVQFHILWNSEHVEFVIIDRKGSRKHKNRSTREYIPSLNQMGNGKYANKQYGQKKVVTNKNLIRLEFGTTFFF